jgi:ATP-dependent Clp protease adaptor protein ClpS
MPRDTERQSQRTTVETLDERLNESIRDTDGPWVVILYNCDCHTFDEVILQLQKATGCPIDKAVAIAVEAHTRGRAIALSGERSECERVAAVLRAIRLQVETDTF